MTGRESEIVLNRAKELEIDYVFQNVKDKVGKLKEFAAEINCSMDEIAYIGDDVMDLGAMLLCGLKGCPSDAVDEVKAACDFVSVKRGGEGAVRDFIEWIVKEGFTCGGND
jgi:3-deoxy-D-manno-octulosonate 8-phosphate phosphatase (KDO 8-P phosphatase)